MDTGISAAETSGRQFPVQQSPGVAVMGLVVVVVLIVAAIGYVVLVRHQSASIISPIMQFTERSLDKYTIESLSRRVWQGSQIVFEEAIATASAYTVWRFSFTSDGKKVTGVAHVPASDSGNQRIKLYPVIVQLRGYVDREKYKPGEGTRRSAETFASNGFISLAPDLLGYGGSDQPSNDVFEERFQTYTTAFNLLASIKTLPLADASKIGLWGHSNGGQIALTILEVLGQPIPATLWAPVSKPFPYSILYYTDEFEDKGKLLRKRLAKFEEDYDVEAYSMPNYLERIVAPLQIHQGTADEAVPKKWSDEFNDSLKKLNKDVIYFIYPGADHNLAGAWNTVVARDVAFFKRYLK